MLKTIKTNEFLDEKTLKGWHKKPDKIGHGTGGSWIVEDGVIAGELQLLQHKIDMRAFRGEVGSDHIDLAH